MLSAFRDRKRAKPLIDLQLLNTVNFINVRYSQKHHKYDVEKIRKGKKREGYVCNDPIHTLSSCHANPNAFLGCSNQKGIVTGKKMICRKRSPNQ
jgi:hypothetical protein